ncbi:hypothetical protein GCM10008934_16350 [Virgibacillus salarius]|uniref:hypothetical protein n=1 Tax=Virgibacillus salarius TaxID=447199 RepID=UPI0031E0D7A8
MSYYDRAEQETTYNYDPIDSNWRVFSTYPPDIRKLLEVADITNTVTDGTGRIISIDGYVNRNQIRLFKPR